MTDLAVYLSSRRAGTLIRKDNENLHRGDRPALSTSASANRPKLRSSRSLAATASSTDQRRASFPIGGESTPTAPAPHSA